jgi:IS5 family transposase
LARTIARSEGKLFHPVRAIDRDHPQGQGGQAYEFGKMVKLQEAENQIVTDYEVYEQRPHDADLLGAAIDVHEARLGRAPRLVAADAGFYSARNEALAKANGVKRLCIPNRSTKSRKREQKKRWFRQGQKWRTGCEGRISVAKRRHGLNRCRYKGDAGMKRWVGLRVIADNLINIGRASSGNPPATHSAPPTLLHAPPIPAAVLLCTGPVYDSGKSLFLRREVASRPLCSLSPVEAL